MAADMDTRWRVFLSHTSEMREYPERRSFVAAAERGVMAEGHVVVDMADFPSENAAPADVCGDRVKSCDVYIAILGTRYGSPVRGRPELSYTEFEFETAKDAGIDQLCFLLDEGTAHSGIPITFLIDRKNGARQDAFRARVSAKSTVQRFENPDELQKLVERSLRALKESRSPVPSGVERLAQKQDALFARSALQHLRLMHSADREGDQDTRNKEKYYLGQELPAWERLDTPDSASLRRAVAEIVFAGGYDNERVGVVQKSIEDWGGFGPGAE